MTMISYADTGEMQQIAKELKSLSDDLDLEIKSMYERFSNVPEHTREWVGGQSKYYFRCAARDKKQYLDLSRGIRRLGVEILGEVQDLDDIVMRNYRN